MDTGSDEMKKRTVPQKIVKVVDRLKKNCEQWKIDSDTLITWLEKEGLLSEDKNAFMTFNDSTYNDIYDVEDGTFTGEEFKRYVEKE